LKGRCSSSSLNQWPFSTVKTKKRCSNKSSVGFSYGRLNGGRPSAYRPLTPAKLYINGGTPKKQRLVEREKTNETRREKHKDTNLIFKVFFLEPHNRSKPFPHQYRPKTTKPETSQERERDSVLKTEHKKMKKIKPK